MARHIGIVGCSAEGAALCYRTICGEAEQAMGEHRHPEVTLHTYPLSDYMEAIYVDDWKRVGERMLSSVRIVAQAGAELAVCPDNTIHQALEHVLDESPISWIHIADAVIDQARRSGYRCLGVTGTRYLMTGPVYREKLAGAGLGHHIPGDEEREKIDRIIFGELVKGKFTEEARLYFNRVIARLKDRGCDAVVLGCTEIPLLVDPDDCPLPVLDSTRLLARAALRRSLEPTIS